MKKRIKKNESSFHEVNKPLSLFPNHSIQIFRTFEEQDEYELKEMAKSGGNEILKQLRSCINLSYGMGGYDPKKPSNKTLHKNSKRVT